MFRLLVVAVVAIATAAQDPPKTGSVAGTVIDAQSGDSVRRALVILTREGERPVGANSDREGKFSLADIPPGSYSIDVDRKGYVRAKDDNRRITVAAGSIVADLRIKVSRTGVISGRVIDPEGEPVTGAGVQIVTAGSKPGHMQFDAFSQTDDRGQYRAFFVPPGDYKVAVVYSADRPFTNVRIQSGGKDADAGQAYPTVYYPGTVDDSQAGVVHLQAGAESTGIDIALIRARGVRVRGHVQSPDAGVVAGFIRMAPLASRGRATRTYEAIVDMSKSEFELADVLPGRYRISARVSAVGESRQALSAKQMVEVHDADVEGIELVPAPVRKITGRLVVPEGRKLPGGLIVVLLSRDQGDSDGSGFATVAADGAFSTSDVGPGEYDLFVGSAQANAAEDDLYIGAIRAGDNDVLADGVRVDAAQPPPIEVVLKPNGGAVVVSVADDKGVPVASATVLLRPDPPRERQIALSGNCKTDPKGTCTISGITPGAYHCYAFREQDAEVDPRDPDALKPFEKLGKAVELGEGDRKNLALTPVRVE